MHCISVTIISVFMKTSPACSDNQTKRTPQNHSVSK